MGEKIKILSNDSVTLEVKQVEDSSIQVKYHTLAGHNPNASGDYIGLWRYVPGQAVTGKAKWSTIVDKSTSEDIYWLDTEIDSNAYILGYSQVGDPKQDESVAKNLSACDVVSESYGIEENMQKNISLSLSGDTRSITFNYKLLLDAQSGENWIGIWNDKDDIYSNNPIASFAINTSKEKIHIDDVGFARGHSYKIGYFADGYKKMERKDMMAQIRFEFVEE